MKTIQLSRGKVAIVDDDDFERLSTYRWHAHRYAMTSVNRGDGVWVKLYMHRLVMGAPEGIEVDHKDLDKFNNQKTNLRFATDSEQRRNQKVRKDSTTGITGVTVDRPGTFLAGIGINGRSIRLGRYRTIEEAQAARKAAELVHHGEFSKAIRSP